MAILECKNLTKRFGATAALQDVSLEIAPGRIIGSAWPQRQRQNDTAQAGQRPADTGRRHPRHRRHGPGGRDEKDRLLPAGKSYLSGWMNVRQLLGYFSDFYADFQPQRALEMLARLDIDPNQRIKTMSKGTQEKVQLILVMSRAAKLYLLDEPIGGVDPATRDYILNTIISNYDPAASVVISTHLIADVEQILDEVIFIHRGKVVLQSSVDAIRQEKGCSVDALFREEFKCLENY